MKSIRVPFSFSGKSVGNTSDPSLIAEQKIINVLTTIAGERVMQYGYGASASALLFDVFSNLEFADFKVDALQELRRTISNVEVLDIRVDESFYTRTADPAVATLLVLYRLPLGTTQAVTVKIAVPGLLTEDSVI